MRILGIDFGTKKIGLAISDESEKLAFPFSVINLSKFNFHRLGIIKKVCEENNAGKIILGRPVGYKGDATKILKEIEKFKNSLEKKTGLKVIYENEALTTQQAKRLQGKTKKIDASSAAIILQSYLDRRNSMVK